MVAEGWRWEFEFPFSGSLTSTFLKTEGCYPNGGGGVAIVQLQNQLPPVRPAFIQPSFIGVLRS